MSTPPLDPAPILDLIEAFRRSKTMFAAVELGVFDGKRPWGADGKRPSGADGKRPLGADGERPVGAGMPRLLDACVALGLLEKRGEEYVNTPVADEYLRRSSPRSLSGYIRYSNNVLYPLWAHLEDAVREGTHRWEQTFGPGSGGLFSHFFKTESAKRDFLMGMHGFGMLSSPKVVAAFDLSHFHRMVDLGGATGHLALAAKDRYPGLQVALFDLPEVIEFAKGQIGDRADFVKCLAGDFFQDPLPPADLYAIGRILHDWSEEKIRLLLARIYAALPSHSDGGGALLIAERLIGQDRRGPVGAHMQSLNMLVCTEGRERTLGEYTALLREAGFATVRGSVTGAPLDAVLAEK